MKTVAREYIALKEKKAEIEAEMKKLEKEYLIPNAETVCLLDLKQKVTFIAEKMTTKINAEELFDYFWEQKNVNVIRDHFAITEKELSSLEEGEKLVAKYKENKGLSKASLRVSKMTKDDIKLEESKLDKT